MDIKNGINYSAASYVMRLFTIVVYCHSMVLLEFFVVKQYYSCNFHRMAVNYHDKRFCNIGRWWQASYRGNLLWHFNHIKWKYVVNYNGICITLPTGPNGRESAVNRALDGSSYPS
jgi:hypothetical protein